MKFTKLTIIFIFLLAFAVSVSAQVNPYPNELEGFEFFRNGILKGFTLGVSTKEDVKRIFGEECNNQIELNELNSTTNGCDYDKNWKIMFTYLDLGMEFDVDNGSIGSPKLEFYGRIWDITLIPKKRISVNKNEFSKVFKPWTGKQVWCSNSSYENDNCSWSKNKFYQNSNGLTYAICIKDSKKQCKKGSLNWIEYKILPKLRYKYLNLETK